MKLSKIEQKILGTYYTHLCCPLVQICYQINILDSLPGELCDHATQIFLQWFVTEQVEEEDSVGNVLEQLKLLGDAKGGLFMMDRELAKRQAPDMSTELES